MTLQSGHFVLAGCKAMRGLFFCLHLFLRRGCRISCDILCPAIGVGTHLNVTVEMLFLRSSPVLPHLRFAFSGLALLHTFGITLIRVQFRSLSILNLRIHSLDRWELVGPMVHPHGRRFTHVSPLRHLDAGLPPLGRRNSLTLSLIIVFRHELANAISASVVVRNLRIVHAWCQLCACLALFGKTYFKRSRSVTYLLRSTLGTLGVTITSASH